MEKTNVRNQPKDSKLVIISKRPFSSVSIKATSPTNNIVNNNAFLYIIIILYFVKFRHKYKNHLYKLYDVLGGQSYI